MIRQSGPYTKRYWTKRLSRPWNCREGRAQARSRGRERGYERRTRSKCAGLRCAAPLCRTNLGRLYLTGKHCVKPSCRFTASCGALARTARFCVSESVKRENCGRWREGCAGEFERVLGVHNCRWAVTAVVRASAGAQRMRMTSSPLISCMYSPF